MRSLGVFFCFFFWAASANATDYFWIIGGGPTPNDSQAQIEANVRWVVTALRSHTPGSVLHVFFAGGPNAKDDVLSWIPRKDTPRNLVPLARVFGQAEANGYRFRDPDVPYVESSTAAPILAARLSSEFRALRPGDHAFILYEGHGLGVPGHPSENTLRLWGDTQMSAKTFEQLLNNINPQVPVQFVFTQCFSGGFERLIHPQAEKTQQLTKADRCGFMAQSATEETEGCSASVNTADYRDYTTYFMAALSGRTRDGSQLPFSPEVNSSGVVTPYGAHLYALREANSTDMPRSTSEMYLTRWQPWYFRWFDTGALPNNVYSRLARDVARRLGLPPDGHELIRKLDARRSQDVTQIAALRAERTVLQTQIKSIQNSLRLSIEMRWPRVAQPYTKNFVRFLNHDLAAAQHFIVSDPLYAKLVEKQDRLDALDIKVLDLRRDRTQMDKIRRLRNLSRVLAEFQLHASGQARAAYNRLLSCENLPL